MLKCAKKYGIEFDTLQPSMAIRRTLPLWHHHGGNPARRQTNNKPQSKCLRNNHKVNSSGEGMDVLARLTSPDHSADAKCACTTCVDDRLESKCKNPHKCAVAVNERLDQILVKWDPRIPELDATVSNALPDGEVRFKSPPEIKTLVEGYRIFTKPPPAVPATELVVVQVPIEVTNDVTNAAISTYIMNGGFAEACCGAGIWFSENDPRNVGFRIHPSAAQSGIDAEV
ncbi:hypothetical protein C8R47DRAFT_929048, partial [Mycena vitilis]